MFCQRRCTTADIIMKIMWTVAAVVGVVTLLGYLMSKCDWLCRRTRRLACECGDAVGDATVRIAHAVDDCMTPDNKCNDENDCHCDED